MPARRASLIIGATLTCCIFLHSNLRAGEWQSDLAVAQARAAELNVPLLLHFSADWCVPCKRMEATVLHDSSLLAIFDQEIVACKIDGTVNPHLLSNYQVSSYPSDVILSPDGQVLKRSSGVVDLDTYANLLRTTASAYRPEPVVKREPATQPEATKVVKGLGGYCPVTLSEKRKWKKGDAELKFEFKGITYYMVSERELEEFTKSPFKYAPRMLGCDPVVLTETSRAVPGKTRYGAFFDDQLFLFSTSENRSRFREKPLQYTKFRHALKIDQILKVVRNPQATDSLIR